jgi:hypothetical protein
VPEKNVFLLLVRVATWNVGNLRKKERRRTIINPIVKQARQATEKRKKFFSGAKKTIGVLFSLNG